MTVSSSAEYTRLMRSPTVGYYAIAQGLYLLAFGRQIIARLRLNDSRQPTHQVF
ncbi:hypothetical protein [Komarekiella delphini-convector]|uniref:hypothetical protein n=1 Tax=Komarekiella delphini-convector TaxID=3050158 RepID=UPI00177BFFA9|nr:hypothetical protein [Komarekiella delphini-convector]